MKEARKAQALYERFVAGFLAPLLRGGTIRLDRPIAPGVVAHFVATQSSDQEADDAIEEGIAAIASELVPGVRVPFPERDAVLTGMAAYDLVSMTDPLLRKGARSQILEWHDALVSAIAPPRTRGAALARHAIVSRLLQLSRQDIVVKNWAYTYRFFGRPVPRNVTAMPWLRRVKQQASQRPFRDLLVDMPELGDRLRMLVSRSPVTEILHLDVAPGFRFGTASLAVLSDPPLRGGITRTLVGAGLGRSAPSLGEALRALGEAGAPPALLYFAFLLLYETHVTAALDRNASARGVPSDAASAWFAAVLPAVLAVGGPIAATVELDDDDQRRVAQHAEALGRAAGQATVSEVTQLAALAAPPVDRKPRAAEAQSA
jgi:hypothetical protein